MEERIISFPHMPDIIAFITPQNEEGKRIKFINSAANKDAKIIRILQNGQNGD